MPHFQTIKAFVIARKYYVLGALAVILIGGGVAFSMQGGAPSEAHTDSVREVRVGRVADLMNGASSLSVVGKVESRSEAKISTEASGRITAVRASLGARVGAGQILAEIENASQRAALQQAQGALESAKAAAPNYASTLDSAESAAVTTLLSAYATAENAVKDSSDQMFSNPEGANPQFNVSTADSQAKLDVQNMRPMLSQYLAREKSFGQSLTVATDFETEFTTTESELRAVRTFLDTLIRALSAGISSPSISEAAIASYKADVTAARTAVTASLSAIATSRAALETAKNNAGGGGDISATGAALKQAEGAYNAALANLEKTRVRSPIAGTINSFLIKLGDFVSPSQQVAVVANNGALEVVVFITEEDRTRISVGQKVTLEGGSTGTITKVAPALDPVTGRIEVRIGLPTGAANMFTNGQSIRVELVKSATKPSAQKLSIPITALKMEADRTVVYTVVDGTLVAREITIGKLSGAYVQIESGVDTDTEIVTDARGLKEGQEVVIGSRD